jgi:hypothetical protein
MVIVFSIIFFKSSAPSIAMLLRSFQLIRTLNVLVSLYKSNSTPFRIVK